MVRSDNSRDNKYLLRTLNWPYPYLLPLKDRLVVVHIPWLSAVGSGPSYIAAV
jgi:hypothetical protein